MVKVDYRDYHLHCTWELCGYNWIEAVILQQKYVHFSCPECGRKGMVMAKSKPYFFDYIPSGIPIDRDVIEMEELDIDGN